MPHHLQDEPLGIEPMATAQPATGMVTRQRAAQSLPAELAKEGTSRELRFAGGKQKPAGRPKEKRLARSFFSALARDAVPEPKLADPKTIQEMFGQQQGGEGGQGSRK